MRTEKAGRGTKSPRDCMLKMSAVTQASEAGEGNPRPWAGGVEARGAGYASQDDSLRGYL